jgi:hypothetical protein
MTVDSRIFVMDYLHYNPLNPDISERLWADIPDSIKEELTFRLMPWTKLV